MPYIILFLFIIFHFDAYAQQRTLMPPFCRRMLRHAFHCHALRDFIFAMPLSFSAASLLLQIDISPPPIFYFRCFDYFSLADAIYETLRAAEAP